MSGSAQLPNLVRTAEWIIGTTLPALQELYYPEWEKGLAKITLDPSHPAHSLFELLPSGRSYSALSTRTARHRNSFFPQAIHLMNIWTFKHLTINMKHTTLSYIYLQHTYLLHFKCAPNIPVHTQFYILYIVFVLFCTLSILYICILLFVLSMSCLVTVIRSCCGASVTKTNSSYV